MEWTDWHERHSDKIELIAGVDCWIWSAGRSAKTSNSMHGRVSHTINGIRRAEYAHRAAFFEHNGYMPGSNRHVCHSCGVGLCVRPSHLYDGSPADNGKDMADMGTGSGSLSYDDAFNIRLMYSKGIGLQDIADKFGIAFGSVYPIIVGKSYRHAPFPSGLTTGNRFRKPLSKEEVRDIREMISMGIVQSKISKKHNVAQSIISRIKTGSRHKNK